MPVTRLEETVDKNNSKLITILKTPGVKSAISQLHREPNRQYRRLSVPDFGITPLKNWVFAPLPMK
jgi:hypothetical protein